VKDLGTPLPVKTIDITEALEEGKALFILLPDDTSRHSIEDVRRLMEGKNITAVIALEGCVKEVRTMSPGDLQDVLRTLQGAYEDLCAENKWKKPKPLPKLDSLTPERLVAALRKRPSLLKGVCNILAPEVVWALEDTVQIAEGIRNLEQHNVPRSTILDMLGLTEEEVAVAEAEAQEAREAQAAKEAIKKMAENIDIEGNLLATMGFSPEDSP